MSQLCMYLPAFSSDYSGVCSALFDLNGMVIINDANCCTKNYVQYDEPRWFGHRRTIYCSGLKEINAILGNDDLLIRKISNELDALPEKPKFIAILESPVPSLIGADAKGLCTELQNIFGIPSVGFETTGQGYYEHGIALAIERMTALWCDGKMPAVPNSVNIMGMTPLDYSDNSNASDLRRILEKMGYSVPCSYMMGCTLDDLCRGTGASVNLAVSAGGLEAAKWMKKTFGIPYVAASPVGISSESLKELLETAIAGKEIRSLAEDVSADSRLLIVGDQIIANSMRSALRERYGIQNCTVGSFFRMAPELMLPGDIHFSSEQEYLKALRSGRFSVLAADPLLCGVPHAAGLKKFEIPHVAISSKLHWHEYPTFFLEEFENILASIADAAGEVG